MDRPGREVPRGELHRAECEAAFLLRQLGGSAVVPETAYEEAATIHRAEVPDGTPLPSEFRISLAP